jgi:4-amino-4-deoxy-L-arabinose transferase-like glycosyltransferase
VRASERGVLVGIVVAAALVLRIAFATAGKVVNPLRADAGEYARYAANLCEHGVYSLATTAPPSPDSFRSPGYPALLALVRWVAGDAWMASAIALQVAMGAATVLLVYRIARGFVGFAPSLFAAALCAASPHLVVSSAFVLTECATTFVVTLGVWLLLGAQGPRRRCAAAACLGAAVLCNETLVVVPLVATWAMWRDGRGRALVFVAVALSPFAAWTLRNQATTLARTGGQRAVASISHGSYPGMVFQDPRWFGYPYREDPAQPEFGSSWAKLGEVLGPRVAAEPLRYAQWYLLQKPVWLWSWPLVQGNDVVVYEVANSPYATHAAMRATHASMRFLHAPLMLAAALAAGYCVVRRRRVGWQRAALGGFAVAGTLAYLPVIPDPRYLQPFRPLVFVLAAVALASAAAWCAQRVRARRQAAAAAAPTAPGA